MTGEPAVESQSPELLEGRYALKEVCGKGGTAIVHRALDLVSEKTVAIKFLKGGNLGDTTIQELFDHEFRAISQLHQRTSLNSSMLAATARGLRF